MKCKTYRYWILSGLLTLLLPLSYSVQAQLSLNRPALDSLLDASAKSHSAGLAIYFDGNVILDKPFVNTDLLPCFSVLKSISALAVGQLIADGKISTIEQPVSDFFPEWKPGEKGKISIRHLLNHTSGISFEEPGDDYFAAPDVVKHALEATIVNAPGTKFAYNSKAFLLLLGLIGKASGMGADQYIEQKLFNPMGIRDYRWGLDKAGNVIELFSNPGELAKIGQLVLDKGTFNRKTLVSKPWIEQILKPSQEFAGDCGLLWWIIPKTTNYIVDDALLAQFKKAGVPQQVINKFIDLKGVYVNENIVPARLEQAFGKNWQEVLDKEFYPYYPARSRREYSKEIIGYKAEGYGGQYIVIYPEKRLVAVRMVRMDSGYNAATDEMLDFQKYVYRLVN